MNVGSVNASGQSIMFTSQSKQDNYEKDIEKQIATLQEKMKNINNDKEMSMEEKINEKKKLQEQIQALNNELRQYQAQKRQKEAAERQEAVKRAAENNIQPKQKEKTQTGLGEMETGVILSLSTTKEQMEGIRKLRADLQGKLRTAKAAEEKEDLQEKLNKLNERIGKKIQESQNTIEEYQKTEKEKVQDNKTNKSEQVQEKENDKEKINSMVISTDHKDDLEVMKK